MGKRQGFIELLLVNTELGGALTGVTQLLTVRIANSDAGVDTQANFPPPPEPAQATQGTHRVAIDRNLRKCS
ncbi:hypothetical protein D3C81_2234560 [compost metagenome]